MEERAQRITAYQKASKEADKQSVLGRRDQARDLIKEQLQAAQQAGDEDYAFFFQAELLCLDGNYQKAAERQDAALAWAKEHRQPQDSFLLTCRGVYESCLNKVDTAIEWYEKALAINPNDSNAMRNKGVSLSKKGEDDAAIGCYDRALATNPKDSDTMRSKGILLSKKGEADAAIECFNKALEVNPKDSDAMVMKGNELSKKGEADAAIECFNKALEINPKDCDAMRQKGVSLCKKGQEDAAIECFNKALEANPKDSDAMRQKGVSYSFKGDEDTAIECFNKALEINPKDSDAMRNKGVWLSKKGQDDAAIEWYDRALAANPQDSDAMRQKGVSLSKKGQEDAAIGWYDKALEINPKDSSAMRNKGVSLSCKGQEDAAIKWFDKALEINPKDSSAMHNKGVSLFNLDRIQEAIESLARAAKLEPAKWQDDFRAVCKYLGKDPDKEWKQFFQETPTNPIQSNDPYGELRFLIKCIRDAYKVESKEYLETKEKAEKERLEFLKPESRFAQERSFLMVLRKWNSYTPALPVSDDDERSRGGGYFLWHKGHGTVIDPGFNFLENFHQAGGRICDIHNVVLTHAHADHTAEFETLRTLLFEYNDNLKEINAQRSKKIPTKHVRFFMNLGSFRKFAGLLDLRENSFTESVIPLNSGEEHELSGGGMLRALPAYHDELLSRQYSIGLFFTLGEGETARRILFTSDTGLFPLKQNEAKPAADDSDPQAEVGRRYLEYLGGHKPDLLVAHIGSIKPDEFDSQKTGIAESCYPNHLGIIGTARVIAMCKPRLAVISEFGEEMKDFRYSLIKHLNETVLPLYFKDRGGNSPKVVPGDLAFVYSILDHHFIDCAKCDWASADDIAFWESVENTDIYYSVVIPTNPERIREAVKRYKGHRDGHEGLYFAPLPD